MKFQFCLRTLVTAFLILNVGIFTGFKLHEWKYEEQVAEELRKLKRSEESMITARKLYLELAVKRGDNVIFSSSGGTMTSVLPLIGNVGTEIVTIPTPESK